MQRSLSDSVQPRRSFVISRYIRSRNNTRGYVAEEYGEEVFELTKDGDGGIWACRGELPN